MTEEYDNLFAGNRAQTTGFKFDQQVVKVFPDMIARSVPGYELVVPMIGLLARRYAWPDTKVYDLGCSLGAASLAMGGAIRGSGVEIIAVDNSPAMVEKLRKSLNEVDTRVPIHVFEQDILATRIENASVVVLNYTLQFIDRDQRETLLAAIAAGMNEGGCLIISEKVRFDSEEEQVQQTDWHHDFKRTQGYSELEISQKRDALEDVLRPDTEQQHFQRLQRAGFHGTRRWFQCFSFASYIAFK